MVRVAGSGCSPCLLFSVADGQAPPEAVTRHVRGCRWSRRTSHGPADAAAQTRGSSPSSSLAGSNVVESAAILMEFATAPHAPKHEPGNTHHNTVTTPNTLTSAWQGVWILIEMLVSGAGGHVGGEDVVGVAVEVLAGSVVAHGGAGVGVAGGDLDITQINSGIQHGCDEGYLYLILKSAW